MAVTQLKSGRKRFDSDPLKVVNKTMSTRYLSGSDSAAIAYIERLPQKNQRKRALKELINKGIIVSTEAKRVAKKLIFK